MENGYIKAIRKFYEEYYSSIDFKKWQDEFSRKILFSLNSNVISGEVKTVTDLCAVMSNQRYKDLIIEGRKIHGKTSIVKFDRDNKKPIKKELADMVIVSVVTLNKKIMLLKTAFIQNKKATKRKTSCSWKIDQEQLFLLKNFPTFTGVSGIFKGKTKAFPNHSGSLGNYGLFTPTGDMVFLTARNVFCHQNSSGTITYDNIKKNSSLQASFENKVDKFCSHCDDCCQCVYFNYKTHFALLNGWHNLPFFNIYSYALDVHEIVKELTYFNIGESLNIFGQITKNNDALYCYTFDILKSFGYGIDDNNNLYPNRDNNTSDENKANGLLIRLELG